jgi:hypothetical protein
MIGGESIGGFQTPKTRRAEYAETQVGGLPQLKRQPCLPLSDSLHCDLVGLRIGTNVARPLDASRGVIGY